MDKMKLALLSTLTVFSMHGLAADNTKSEEKLDAMKQHDIERADKEIEMAQQFKSCVTAAADKSAIESCRKNKMDAMKQFHEERKDAMHDMKDHHQEKMDDMPPPPPPMQTK